MRVAHLGRSSVTYEIALFRQGDNDAAATGRFVHVWVDRERRRPIRRTRSHSRSTRSFAAAGDGNAVMVRAGRRFANLECARMTAATRPQARRLLASFLAEDPHYRASATTYGDGGPQALDRALELFVARPEMGFVWLASAADAAAVGACVVCYAISTSRGGLVAKLDDVTIDPARQRAGRRYGDAHGARCAFASVRHWAHRHRVPSRQRRAWRFYERQGFRPLDEERIALVL